MVGTGNPKCLMVLCEVGLGTCRAAPSPWAMGRAADPLRALGAHLEGAGTPQAVQQSSSLPVMSPQVQVPARASKPRCSKGRPDLRTEVLIPKHPGFAPQPTSSSKTRLLGQGWCLGADALLLGAGAPGGVIHILLCSALP